MHQRAPALHNMMVSTREMAEESAAEARDLVAEAVKEDEEGLRSAAFAMASLAVMAARRALDEDGLGRSPPEFDALPPTLAACGGSSTLNGASSPTASVRTLTRRVNSGEGMTVAVGMAQEDDEDCATPVCPQSVDAPAPLKALALGWFGSSQSRLRRPCLWYQPDGFMQKIVERMPRLHQPYVSFVANGTCHLLFAAVYRAVIHPLAPWSAKRELLTTPDGGTLSIDWFKGFLGPFPHTVFYAPTTPIVLMLHAFAGNSLESYCITAMRAATRMGWRAASMNYRGCGGTPLTSPRPFCVGASIDIYTVVAHIKQKFPGAPLFMMGFSIGAYTLTKYVAEVDSGQLPADGKLAGAMCCGSGFDYQAEMNKITAKKRKIIDFDWIERIYWNMYLHKFKDVLQQAPDINWDAMKSAKTVADLEACFIPTTWGYKDMADYYDSINALKLIPLIRTPTLFFSAQDDPFLDMSVAPIHEVQANPFAAFALTKGGGHCGHLGMAGWARGLSVIDVVMQEMFQAILKLTEKEKAQLERRYQSYRSNFPFRSDSRAWSMMTPSASLARGGSSTGGRVTADSLQEAIDIVVARTSRIAEEDDKH